MTHRAHRPLPGAPPVWVVCFRDPVSVAGSRRVVGDLVDDASARGAGGVVLVDVGGVRRLTDAWVEMLDALRRSALGRGVMVRARRDRDGWRDGQEQEQGEGEG